MGTTSDWHECGKGRGRAGARGWVAAMTPVLAAAVVVIAAVASGCREESPAPNVDKRPITPASGVVRVVATTGMVADAASAVGGPHAQVTRLMGEGVDPHLYKPAPGDLRVLESADLVLYNGLHLEGKLADSLTKLGDRRPVVAVAEAIPTDRLIRSTDDGGSHDPHVWLDPRLWSLVVEAARDALQRASPANEASIRAAADAYLGTLGRLHAWAEEQLATIPPERRVLVTAHDAFAYFGRAYGLEVHGVQGISTESESSIQDMNALVDLLVEKRVPAVFFESSVPPRAVRALIEGCRARGHEVRIGGELFSDALGPDGTPQGTYFGMFEHNVRTIVEALSGKPAAPFSKPHDESR